MKALIAMSGGVDSSVAAKLMQDAGYDCIGCTMKLYNNPDAGCSSKTCCSLSDVEDARSVAARLHMPYYVFNYTEEFKKDVMEKFARSYTLGHTPNPCIDCNRFLKFGACTSGPWNWAATVWSPAITPGSGRPRKGSTSCSGPRTSQGPELCALQPDPGPAGPHPVPPGGYHKTHTREIAAENGFINSQKPDSQDICFVPNGQYTDAVQRILDYKPQPGPFLDLEGKVIGQHKGIIYYTLGQHKKLGLNQPDYPCMW